MREASSIPSVDSIRGWISHEEAALEAIRAKLTPMLEDQRRGEDRLARLKDLLSAYDVPQIADAGDLSSQARPSPHVAGPQSVSGRVRGQVREILAARTEPMHIVEIHAAFIQRGWEVPGAGTPANITAHLSKDPDIVSPSRGFYRLYVHGESLPAKKTRAKRQSTKTRRQPTTRKR